MKKILVVLTLLLSGCQDSDLDVVDSSNAFDYCYMAQKVDDHFRTISSNLLYDVNMYKNTEDVYFILDDRIIDYDLSNVYGYCSINGARSVFGNVDIMPETLDIKEQDNIRISTELIDDSIDEGIIFIGFSLEANEETYATFIDGLFSIIITEIKSAEVVYQTSRTGDYLTITKLVNETVSTPIDIDHVFESGYYNIMIDSVVEIDGVLYSYRNVISFVVE